MKRFIRSLHHAVVNRAVGVSIRAAIKSFSSRLPRDSQALGDAFVSFLEGVYPRLLSEDKFIHLLQPALFEFNQVVINKEIIDVNRGPAPATARSRAERRALAVAKRRTVVAEMPVLLTDAMWVRRFGFTRQGFRTLERLVSLALLPRKKANSNALRPRETLMMALMYCRNGERRWWLQTWAVRRIRGSHAVCAVYCWISNLRGTRSTSCRHLPCCGVDAEAGNCQASRGN